MAPGRPCRSLGARARRRQRHCRRALASCRGDLVARGEVEPKGVELKTGVVGVAAAVRSRATDIVTKCTEGRCGGTYVTGNYSSTGYRSGDAQVVSMALQFFADPKDALKPVDGDPMHAGLVLRSFEPADYKTTSALRPFDDKFLPKKQLA